MLSAAPRNRIRLHYTDLISAAPIISEPILKVTIDLSLHVHIAITFEFSVHTRPTFCL